MVCQKAKKMKILNYLCTAFILLLGQSTQAQLTVTSGNPAAAIVDTLVGTGVSVANVTYTGNANSKGTFRCTGGCNLGITRGVFLSTGNTGQMPTSPPSDFHSSDMSGSGDAQLNLIVSPNLTQDAAVLEFDFTPAADSVGFKFVFASEEYNDYVNTAYNDVFAFYISGPGIPGSPKNLALIPGTSIPVSINNVNNGNSAGAATGPCNHCANFVDNVPNGGTANFFDGFTTVISAGIKVMPCQTYHMKFAIADVNDGVFDSGVFLEAKSFSSIGNVGIAANGVQIIQNLDTVYACDGDSVVLTASPAGSYNWNNGQTTQTIVVTQANITPSGVYQYAVLNSSPACFASSKQVKVIFVTPTATITPLGSTALCPGGSVVLQANPGSSYLWSNGATSDSIVVSAAGTYTVTVTQFGNCYAVSTPVVVTQSAPVAAINGVLTICSGSNTTLTATAGASYLWSTGATTQSVSVGTSNTYTVTVTYSGGCTATASVNVTANTNPVPSITGNNSICQGQSSTINAGSYAGYLWSTGATAATINVNTAGNYSVTVTDANGCTGTASFNLTVNANPTPTITGVTSFCAGENSTLNAGGGYTNYLWSGGATTQTINVTAGGNYAVTVANAAGCTATTNKVITVNALPVPAISGPAGICPGASANLFAGSYASYLWSNGNTTPSITTNVSGNYTVTVTDANGCVGSSNYNLLAFQNPIPVISGTAAICQNQNSVLDAGSFASWQWSTGAVSQTISVTQSGTYSVTVTNTDGCVASTSFNVVVNPLPVPIISGTSAFCSGNSSVLTTGGGSFTSYQWNTSATSNAITVTAQGNYVVTVTDANGCTASTNQAVTVWNLPTPVITGNNSICSGTQTTLSAGNYSAYQWSTGATTDSIAVSNGANYIVTVTDVNGCSGTSAPFALTINQLPTAIISGSTAICIGQSTSLQIQFTGTAPYSYRYSDGTSVSAILNTNNSAAQILVTPGTTTDYTLTQINDANCTGNVSGVARVVVNPLPQPVISGSAGECDGITATLTTGNFAAYLWSTGATSQSIAVNSSGSYVCTVTSTAGCKASAIHNFEAYPVPVVSFTNDSSLTCELPIINFTNTSQYQLGSVFEWNIDNTIYNSLNATHQFSGSGSYTVSLTITSPKNCVGEAIRNVNITVFPLPQASFTIAPDQAPLFNSEVAFGDASANAVSWLWDFGDGDTSTLQNVSHFYADPGKYNAKLYVTNVAGCIDSLAREIFITPFYIPNAFTPNGDGRNETFFDPGYATNVQSLTMNIYNRWGQLVYTTDNLSKTWDGIDSKGNLSPQGVYVYALKVTTYSGKHYDYTGSVSLIR